MVCPNEGCLYNDDGYCDYDNAKIKCEYSRGCYEDMRRCEIDMELDYLDGTW